MSNLYKKHSNNIYKPINLTPQMSSETLKLNTLIDNNRPQEEIQAQSEKVDRLITPIMKHEFEKFRKDR